MSAGKSRSDKCKRFAKRDTLIAPHINQAMRNVILVEKIVELTTVARIVHGQDTKARKVSIAVQAAPSHDQSIHDRLADLRHLGKGPPQLSRGDL